MKYLKTIDENTIDYVWVSLFYDHPLEGTCLYDGSLCKFETEYREYQTKIYSLSLIERIYWKISQKLFEFFVGYHNTYQNDMFKKYPYKNRPKMNWIYYNIVKIIFG